MVFLEIMNFWKKKKLGFFYEDDEDWWKIYEDDEGCAKKMTSRINLKKYSTVRLW